MSSLTTNLKLVKPELQDNITPTIFADNFDKIDAALEGVSGGALSLEEIEASTNLDGKIPSAAALKEVNNSLVASDGQKLFFDSKNGKYGYNTDPNRGADTFVPFSSNPLGDDYFYMIGSKLAIELSGNAFVPNDGAFKLVSKTAGNYFRTVSTKVDITKYKTLEMKYSLYNHNGYTNNSKAIVVLKKNKPDSYTDAKTIESGDILLLETNMDSGTMHDKTIDLSAYSGEYYLTYYLYQNYTGFSAGIYTQFLRMK